MFFAQDLSQTEKRCSFLLAFCAAVQWLDRSFSQAESRLARLQKDVGLLKHKGEEEEMAESILKAKTG